MSKAFLKWTIDTIREDKSLMNWIEERKFEWVPLVTNIINRLLKGQSIVIITDIQREWFAEYIISTINSPTKERPILPFVELKNIYPYLDGLKDNKDIDLIYDMLSISFESGFVIWYIGSCNSERAQIAKRLDDNFLWIMDEELQNSFSLSSSDELLDFKLLQLFRLFDKSISIGMFSEIDLSA